MLVNGTFLVLDTQPSCEKDLIYQNFEKIYIVILVCQLQRASVHTKYKNRKIHLEEMDKILSISL